MLSAFGRRSGGVWAFRSVAACRKAWHRFWFCKTDSVCLSGCIPSLVPLSQVSEAAHAWGNALHVAWEVKRIKRKNFLSVVGLQTEIIREERGRCHITHAAKG